MEALHACSCINFQNQPLTQQILNPGYGAPLIRSLGNPSKRVPGTVKAIPFLRAHIPCRSCPMKSLSVTASRLLVLGVLMMPALVVAADAGVLSLHASCMKSIAKSSGTKSEKTQFCTCVTSGIAVSSPTQAEVSSLIGKDFMQQVIRLGKSRPMGWHPAINACWK